jgi:LuxR family maltose regulon positive regulatory protein
MTAPILITKLYIPPTRAELVPRTELIEHLNNGLDRKLTLISAPAGFGKTTLVSHWLENLRADKETHRQPLQVAWLSLDEDDNDPVRFLTYFITAFNQINEMDADLGQGALSMLQSPQPPPANTVLTALINDLAVISEKIIFVLDDYHLIESEPIHQALIFLLENLPPQLHLVIATRQDPPLSLGRLRARAQMTELRAADLRFTSSEAADFLNRVMGLDLSPEDIAELETRTEGWIAGLQLAAISMRGYDDRAGFIKSFTGGHRLVLDFLIEEVLSQQSKSVQDFLLKTSILNRLTGPLCDAVTGQENGEETLEMLDRANLFIVHLDEERCWYRYHHLFADLLHQRLISYKNGAVKELYAKAAVWYETHGDLSEAVYHALAGDDIKSATRLIEKGALAALENSDFRFILDSVERLPESVLQSSPWLFIYHAWALLLTGHVEAANPKLENIDGLLGLISENDEIQQREMLGNIAGLKMISAGWNRDHENMPEYADQVREYLPENNWIRAYCAMMMGGFYWGNGNLEAAIDAFAESSSAGAATGNKMVAVSGACNHAHSLELAGHLQQAIDLFQDTFKLTEQDGRVLPVANYIHKEIARVLYELNELERANQHLLKAIELGQQMADERAEKIGYGLLAKVQIATGNFANANLSIRNAEQAIPNLEIEFDLRGSDYPQVWLWLKQNQIRKLERWLKENPLTIEEISHFKTKFTLAMHARVLIALYREYQDEIYIRKALELLDSLLEIAETNGWGSKVIETLALQAVAFQENGNSEGALAKLEQALTLAEPEGFIRTFVDEGAPMASLLYEALKRGIAPAYVQRLLAAFPVTESEEAISTTSQAAQSEWIEPLSEREIDVLQLLAKGLTNQAVADRLVLSIHTVKAHTRSIYSKLAVNNRTQAVDRARTLGVLPPI